MTVAKLLREHLARTREPQAAFARRIGLTPQTVSQLVRGDIKVPTADVRRKLAAALGVRHVDILVAAGELAIEETAPLPETYVADHRLRELIDAWPNMDPEAQRFLHSFVGKPGVMREEDEERVAALGH